MIREENTLFVEKYRPTSIDDYICGAEMKGIVQAYINKEDIPHLLLYGDAGGGKTTLAKILVNNIDCDYIYINASDENNIDTVRDKIKSFASSVGFSPLKVIILDEAEYLTPNAQAALRNLMETFSLHSRFILTCNYVEKIIDPIRSRCQEFNIFPPSKVEVAKRMISILQKENVKWTSEDIATVIKSNYPDIRRIINTIQRSIIDGEFRMDELSIIETNYASKVVDLLMTGKPGKEKYKEIRKFISENKVRDFQILYRELYDRSEEIFIDQSLAILEIAEFQYKEAFVVDKEINVIAMIIKLLNNIKK